MTETGGSPSTRAGDSGADSPVGRRATFSRSPGGPA